MLQKMYWALKVEHNDQNLASETFIKFSTNQGQKPLYFHSLPKNYLDMQIL